MTPYPRLAESVADLISGKPGVFGLYARNLGTDETVAINADRIFPAESAAKTFILVHYSRLVAAGTVDPKSRVRLGDTKPIHRDRRPAISR